MVLKYFEMFPGSLTRLATRAYGEIVINPPTTKVKFSYADGNKDKNSALSTFIAFRTFSTLITQGTWVLRTPSQGSNSFSI